MLESKDVSISIYAFDGKKVIEWKNGNLSSGAYSYNEDMYQLVNGMYFIKFAAGEEVSIGKWIKE